VPVSPWSRCLAVLSGESVLSSLRSRDGSGWGCIATAAGLLCEGETEGPVVLELAATLPAVRTGIKCPRLHDPFRGGTPNFQTRTLTPFAIYCVAFGAASILHFG
jgi:hypothetical protein